MKDADGTFTAVVVSKRAFACGFLVIALASSAWPQTYTAVDLNPVGSEYSEAYGLSGGQQVGYGYMYSQSPTFDALVWSGNANNFVNLGSGLASDGADGAVAVSISGGQQVGYEYVPDGQAATGYDRHALLWSGTAASAVSLHPIVAQLQPPFTDSLALAVSGGQQVGWASRTTAAGETIHALLWSGTAASAVDLTPAGFTYAYATGISGGQQVGYGLAPSLTTNQWHALLWSGNAASCADLNPVGFDSSLALAISSNQQVGEGWQVGSPYNQHALLWSGTTASAVDLNPVGFSYSQARGVADGQQVGWGYGSSTENNTNALLWSGSAASVVNLQNFLPSAFTSSAAYAIDSNGDIVGSAVDGNGNIHAILWTPATVPEPNTFALVALGFGLVLGRRRRKHLSPGLITRCPNLSRFTITRDKPRLA